MKSLIAVFLLVLVTQFGCAGDLCETNADCAPNHLCVDTGGVLLSGKECVESLGSGTSPDAAFDQNTPDTPDQAPDTPDQAPDTPDRAPDTPDQAPDVDLGEEPCELETCNDGDACTANAECTSGVCQRGYCKLPGFSVIPSGTYTQGSPTTELARQTNETQRSVTLTRAFFMQETEVTQAEWFALMGNNPSNFTAAPAGNRPVETVSWWEAIAYMNALSADEGLQQCYVVSGCTGTPGVIGSSGSYSCSSIIFEGLDCTGYRLPTEAEWEYAARAGTTTSTYAGDHNGGLNCDANPMLSSIAWWCGNENSTTQNVGQKTPPHPWGLHDMIGNVWEWNWDWLATWTSASVTDPLGPATGFFGQVVRGCAWGDYAGSCRSAYRGNGAPPSYRSNYIGFRPVRSIP